MSEQTQIDSAAERREAVAPTRREVVADFRLLPDKREIVDAAGITYLAFRQSLKPRYGRLRVHVVGCDLLLIGFVVAPTAWAGSLSVWQQVGAAVGLALVLGYLQYQLSLLGHAAAHGELAENKRTNDRLANALIFPVIGLLLSEYQRIHWAHHRLLGRPDDPEDGYREALSLGFLLRSLSGLRFLSAVVRHSGPTTDKPTEQRRSTGVLGMRVAAAIVHLAAVIGPIVFGAWYVSLAWAVAVGIVTPTLSAVRLILEHRPGAGLGPREGDAVVRCFRGGLFTSWFGAAGFRSHLIHHWDPQVHSTQLRAVERFLASTGARADLLASTTTYPATFVELAS